VDPGVFAPPSWLSIGPDSAGIPQEIRSRCRLMPIMEHPRTPELPRSAQKSISIPEQVVAVARRPEAHMASRLFEIVAGMVRLSWRQLVRLG
jgi:hypothetical protein